MEVRVRFATLLKIALAVLVVACVVKLWPVIVMVIIAVLLAVMTDPLVGLFKRRWMGIALVAILLLGLVAFLLLVVVPHTASELVQLSREVPQLAEQVTKRFPSAAPLINAMRTSHVPTGPQLMRLLTRGVAAGILAFEAITASLFTIVLAIYLLIEGRRAFQWLITFAEPPARKKLERTGREMSGVVRAYMRGQAITCFLCGGWAYLVLLLCHVPGALALATLAFFADLVPVVGTIVMTLPAVLLALLVGPSRALIVVAAYMLYHFVESYFIIPRVYGDQMRLSTLTVLLAVAAGGTLQGALGAVLILPIVAGYPIVERIWLREKLPEDAVERHEAMEEEGG